MRISFICLIVLAVFGHVASKAAILSPFFSTSQGELDSVIETETFVVLIELDFAKLRAGDYKTCYVARIWNKSSVSWRSVEHVHSETFLDGGSRSILFTMDGDEFKFDLPTARRRKQEEAEPFGTVNGGLIKVVRYGASGIGFSEVSALIKPLYSKPEQTYIEQQNHPRDFGAPTKNGFVSSLVGSILNRNSSRAPVIQGTPNCEVLLSPRSTTKY